MKKFAVVLVGTSIVPIITILNFLWNNQVEKVYLLGTDRENFLEGTKQFCDNLKEHYSNKDIEVKKIARSNIKDIKEVIEKEILKNIEESSSNEKQLYFDYTGGTKIQAAFIKEYLESRQINNTTIYFTYVDGENNKIKEKTSTGRSCIELSNIDGNSDNENISLICNVKALNIDDYKKLFEKIEMKNFKIKFFYELKNRIEFKNNDEKGKEKVKLELFQVIYMAEKLGEEFSEIYVYVDDGNEEKYKQILSKEFLGIKYYEYKERINFCNKL